MSSNAKRPPAPAKPSSSILLLSPRNQILLLARVKTSSSFPSAHVFPGGNVDARQDGTLPSEPSFARHDDGPVYRLAAIRECFEESGLLLAKPTSLTSPSPSSSTSPSLLSIPTPDRDAARRAIHANTTLFTDWVSSHGGTPDVDGLVPFTRFITPTTVPKRFSTQMYLYFLPLDAGEEGRLEAGKEEEEGKMVIPVPTADGGVEHTEARFAWPKQWLDWAAKGDVIMYPPQVLLCHLIAPFFPEGEWGRDELQKQRERCLEFVHSGQPPWSEKCMSPDFVLKTEDGRGVLGLKKPGLELEGSERKGDDERVVLVRNTKEGPRDVEVRWRKDVMREARESQEKDKGKL